MAGGIKKFKIKDKDIVIVTNHVTGKTTVVINGEVINVNSDPLGPVYQGVLVKIENALNELAAPIKKTSTPLIQKPKKNM